MRKTANEKETHKRRKTKPRLDLSISGKAPIHMNSSETGEG